MVPSTKDAELHDTTIAPVAAAFSGTILRPKFVSEIAVEAM
jgi:hypothetical protein